MDEKTEFRLMKKEGDTFAYAVLEPFPSIEAAKARAEQDRGREPQDWYIERVVTTRVLDSMFHVAAMPKPSLDDIAGNMASVYMQSVDWEDEDFLALTKAERDIVREMVNDMTDTCENCGWEFESHYLSAGDHGLVCDRCESELADEDEERDDDDD